MANKKIVKNYLYDLAYQILLLITPLLTTPYISRVLGATNLGIYDYVSANAAYFVLLGTVGTSLYGRREVAFYQDDQKKRTKVFFEIVIIRGILTTFALILYFLLFCNGNKYSLIYRVFILDIIANMFDISWFFQGMQDFKKTVIRNAIVKMTGIIFIFLFVKNENQLPLYSVCTTLPILLGHLTLWPYLKDYISNDKIKIDLHAHIKPIFEMFIPQIAIEIYTVLDKTMIGRICENIAEVGYYAQAQKIIKIVLKLVTSIGVVMLPAMALDYMKGNEEQLQKSIFNSFRYISFIGIPVMLGVIGISDNFVPWFYGKGYEPITNLLKIMSVLIVIVGYSTVIGSQYLLATKQEKIYTVSVIVGSIINFLCNLLLIPSFGSLGASLASVFAELSVSTIQIIYTRKKIPVIRYSLQNWKYYFSGMVMFFLIFSLGYYLPTGFFSTLFQILVGMIIYFLLVIVLKDDIISEILNELKRRNKKSVL